MHPDPAKKAGFMCKTDFDHELSNAKGGSLVYASENNLRAERACIEECGIVEVEVRLVRVVKEDNFFGSDALPKPHQ
jgi:hypothetical protein